MGRNQILIGVEVRKTISSYADVVERERERGGVKRRFNEYYIYNYRVYL